MHTVQNTKEGWVTMLSFEDPEHHGNHVAWLSYKCRWCKLDCGGGWLVELTTSSCCEIWGAWLAFCWMVCCWRWKKSWISWGLMAALPVVGCKCCISDCICTHKNRQFQRECMDQDYLLNPHHELTKEGYNRRGQEQRMTVCSTSRMAQALTHVHPSLANVRCHLR